jgi:cell division protein FtsB
VGLLLGGAIPLCSCHDDNALQTTQKSTTRCCLAIASTSRTDPEAADIASQHAEVQALVDFQKQLSDECAGHQSFLERMDESLKQDLFYLVSATTTVFVGLMAWFNFRNRRDVDVFLEKNAYSKLKKATDKFKKESESATAEIAKSKDQQSAVIAKMQADLKSEFQTHLTREGEIATAVAQSLIALGLYGAGKKVSPSNSWNEQLEPLLDDIQKRLEELLARDPGSRLLVLQRARFYDEYKNQLNSAIQRIKTALAFRDTKRQQEAPPGKPTPKNADDSALLFNLACYLNRSAKSADKTQFESEKLKEAAKDAIYEALFIVPGDTQEAKDDADIKDLFTTDPPAGS